MPWSTHSLPSQLGPKWVVPSCRVGLFLSEFSAENSDLQIFMNRGTDALKLLRIIYGNKNFSSQFDTKYQVRIMREHA